MSHEKIGGVDESKLDGERGFVIGSIEEAAAGTGGWFIGWFMEKVERPDLATDKVAVGLKEVPLGPSEFAHYHKEALEVNVCISGEYTVWVRDELRVIRAGEFLLVEPGTVVRNFSSEPGTMVLTIHVPSLPKEDKVEVEVDN